MAANWASFRVFRSFTFRLAMVIFLVFIAALFAVRFSIYYGAVSEAEQEVYFIINGEETEISTAIKKHGIDYGLNIISTVVENDRDHMFAIMYVNSKGKKLEGNLNEWPELRAKDDKWSVFEVDLKNEVEDADKVDANDNGDNDDDDDSDVRQYLGTVKTYPSGSKLLIGYDMRHIQNIRSLLESVWLQNVIFSTIAAIFCSFMITLIISRRLRDLNKTCEKVIDGELAERVKLNLSGDEFDKLGSNFNSMLEWISELISNTKETTDNLAHDMRTPLNRHRIRLQKILDNPETKAETRAEVEQAVNEIDRLVMMFDSILSISKAEAKSNIAQFAEFDLRELIDDLLDLYSFLAEQKNITIISKVTEALSFKGDRQLFAQAMMNLIDNAIKYTNEGGRVEIDTKKTTDKIKITIADNGPGIPAEFHEKVKERFFRLDKSRTTLGSGLGLSLVSAVVKLHHGEMKFFDNKPGLKVVLSFKL